MRIISRYPALTALVAGGLTPLGFSPFDQFWLPPLTLACLFVLWFEGSIRQQIVSALLYGIGLFGVGVSWVYISLHTFGEMPVALAAVCVAGFVLVLASFPVVAIIGSQLVRVRCPAMRLVLVFPAMWVLAEWLRNNLFTGFSWLEIGYSQASTFVGQWATVIGIHGVSLLTALSAGLIAATLLKVSDVRWRWLTPLVLIVAGGWLVQSVTWTEPTGGPVRAALIQADVPLSTKWDFEAASRVARTHFSLSQKAGTDVDIIVWPESPLPFFIDQMGPGFYDRVISLPAPLLSGFLERRPKVDGGFDYFNSAILFTDPPSIYRKRHLVPFGEYTPLEKWFAPIIGYLNIPMSVLSQWPDWQPPMPIAGHLAAVSICYEDAFPGDIRKAAGQAGFMINISEDAWFGDSLAPHQRLQMARFRTIETGRPMLRTSNTGLAAVIDYQGRVIATSPQFVEYVLKGSVQPRTGLTPYVRYADWPVALLLLMMLMTAVLVGGKSMRRLVVND
ncbi:MAG: apolipoprotein N-acyltransferase [marine bacterium B5-7]|nr:MAG: apolipoprotein N-acyltransferase [marine bacterium B5-7]